MSATKVCTMCILQAMLLPTAKCGICIPPAHGHTGKKNAVITKQYAIVTIANILCRKVGLVKQVLWFPMPFTFILPTAK